MKYLMITYKDNRTQMQSLHAESVNGKYDSLFIQPVSM